MFEILEQAATINHAMIKSLQSDFDKLHWWNIAEGFRNLKEQCRRLNKQTAIIKLMGFSILEKEELIKRLSK